jgi:hypothetical protein
VNGLSGGLIRGQLQIFSGADKDLSIQAHGCNGVPVRFSGRQSAAGVEFSNDIGGVATTGDQQQRCGVQQCTQLLQMSVQVGLIQQAAADANHNE